MLLADKLLDPINKLHFRRKMNALTLYELNGLVAEFIATALDADYWVEAEISEIRVVRGHCYMELVQKSPESRTPIARASAKCWRTQWTLIENSFQRATGRTICAGISVMMCVHADFHEAYGFSWIVTDINPEYTLGDMARRRREIVEQLQRQGIYDLQHQLSMPLFAQRIAVISGGTTAGYDDFCHQLTSNTHGGVFHTQLFSAVMQGESTESSVVDALNRIYAEIDNFDVVVIIRGGGATSDMSGFDTFSLAENVANFPIPIIVGIGHNRDESVLDLVAHTSVKTPTAAATFLVDRLATVFARLDSATATLSKIAALRLERELNRLSRLSTAVPTLFATVRHREQLRLTQLADAIAFSTRHTVDVQHFQLQTLLQRLTSATRHALDKARHRLNLNTQRTENLSPALQLQRGYSITLLGDKIITDPTILNSGDKIVTVMRNGRISSVVESTETHSDDSKDDTF